MSHPVYRMLKRRGTAIGTREEEFAEYRYSAERQGQDAILREDLLDEDGDRAKKHPLTHLSDSSSSSSPGD